MLDWHLGMLERPDGRPLHGLGVANRLSLARAAIVPVLVVLPPTALAALLFAAGASDILDGWIARSRDEVTTLGFWLDPAVDRWVLTVAAVAAARVDRLPFLDRAAGRGALCPALGRRCGQLLRARGGAADGHVRLRAVARRRRALRYRAVRIGRPWRSAARVVGAVGGILTFALTIAAALRNSVASAGPEAVP